MDNELRILSVEDDPDGQVLVSTILTHMNIPMDVAYDAETAGEMLFSQGQHYTAVVIDLALPGKDGWELLAEIRSYPPTAHVPCIAVTAFHNSKLREEALQAGFTAYFAKPLDAMAFARQIEQIM
jgi:two-component system cell cycle response regulator DivK